MDHVNTDLIFSATVQLLVLLLLLLLQDHRVEGFVEDSVVAIQDQELRLATNAAAPITTHGIVKLKQ